MIGYLLVMICVLSLLQVEKNKIAAMWYAGMSAGHAVLFGHLEGTEYFLSAATADALTVAILCHRAQVTRLADLLISISMISGFVNFVGWGMWWIGVEVDAYYYACIAVYSLAVLSLLREDGHCDHSSFVNMCFRRLGGIGYSMRCFLLQEKRI